MAAPREGARVFAETARAGFADCAPSGRVRLDAVARWLQDVAYADVADAGLAAAAAVWVVRRTCVRVERWPRLFDRVRCETFCGGLGRMWAERRTSITAPNCERGARVEAVALWVRLDPEGRRPVPLSAEETALYGGPQGAPRVSARLRHPAPGEHSAAPRAWTFRAAECDVAGHVNNTAYWTAVEEELLRGPEPGPLEVEIEFRAPSQPGEMKIIADGAMRWLLGPGGETAASALLRGPAEIAADLTVAEPERVE